MSKKSRRRNRQKRRQSASRPFPWLWLAGSVGALLIAGLLILQPWAGEDAPQTTPQAGVGPRLAVDQTIIDEGYVKYDVPVRTTFRLTNTGDQLLEILGEPQVRLAAGC